MTTVIDIKSSICPKEIVWTCSQNTVPSNLFAHLLCMSEYAVDLIIEWFPFKICENCPSSDGTVSCPILSDVDAASVSSRSEERRVGKEC